MDILHFSLHFHWPGGAGRSTENGDRLSDSTPMAMPEYTKIHADVDLHYFAKYCTRHIIPDQIINKLTTHSEHGFANYIKNYYIRNYQE